MKLSYQDNANIAATSSGSLSGEAYATAGLGRLAVLLPPNLAPFNNNGGYNINYANGSIGTGADQGFSISYTNPAVALALDRANNTISHAAANVYLQINPLPWITLKTTYGIDYLYTTNDSFSDPVDNFSVSGGVTTNAASASDSYSSNRRSIWDNTLQVDKTFGKHTFSLLLGNEQQITDTYSIGENKSVLSDPAFNVIQAGYVNSTGAGGSLGEDYLVSFFGRLNYNFNQKYFVTATIRRDGSSDFGSNSKYGYFPSLAGGYEITKEDFWKNIGADKIFSSFKIKGGYGRVGNNSGLSSYSSYGSYGSGLYNTNPTLAPSGTGNNNLSWELSSKTDVGRVL
jgi:hypothetical protein